MIYYATVTRLKQEHNEELRAMKLRHSNELKRLVEDRLENGTDGIEVGDIITDHFQCIRVESAKYYCGISEFGTEYHGIRLTLYKHVPYTNEERSVMFSSNIETIEKAAND